ncbi:MAG: hypothetical protein AAGI25_10200 [Bacteroidota bacterium]
MYLILIITFNFFLQDYVSIMKDNGETLILTQVRFYQTKSTSSETTINYRESGEKKTIELSELKRINFKDLTGKKKGVQKWQVILVKRSNVKHDVELNLVEVSGIDSAGKQYVISASSINKIML